MERFRNKQTECKYSDINTKGFCNYNLWSNGLCHCLKKEWEGRKLTIYLCCPYLILN
jgi:hypothetical protein